MKTSSVNSVQTGDAPVDSLDDLKLKVTDYLITQHSYSAKDEVWSIMAETKVGAWRKPALLEKIRTVFSLS